MPRRERSTVRALLAAWLVVGAVLALVWLLAPEAEPPRRQVQARYELQPARREPAALVAPSASSGAPDLAAVDSAEAAAASTAEVDSWSRAMPVGTGRLSGTVTARETGAPLDGVRVTLQRKAGEWYWTRPVTTLSGPGGAYELAALPDGPFEVWAEGDVTDVRREPPRWVVLGPGEERRLDLDVSLAGRVWGTVRGADGAPAKHVKVAVTTGDSVVTQMASLATSSDRLVATTDERGDYVVHGVPFEREWRVWFDEDRHAPALSPSFVLHPTRPQLRVDVTLERGSRVTGRVVDPRGRGVAQAEVLCLPRYGALFAPMRRAHTLRKALSLDEGRFDLGALPSGEYQVMAFRDGFGVQLRGTPIYPDGRTDLTVEVLLRPAGAGDRAVFGVVTDGAGRPLSGASVSLAAVGLGAGSIGTQETTAGPDGAFRFEGVSGDGLLVLTARLDGWRQAVLDRVKRDHRLVVALEREAPLSGVVLRPDGSPAPAFMLRVVRFTGEGEGALLGRLGLVGREEWFEGPDGRFRLDDVPPGRALLEAEADGLAPARLEVQVLAGTAAPEVTLRLPAEGATVRGRVTSGGVPLAGARVTAVEVGGATGLVALGPRRRTRVQATTDARGEFLLERLASATYDVEAAHPDHAPTRRRVTTTAGAAADVALALGRGGTIVGRAGPGVMITVAGQGFSAMASADEEGTYRVQRVPPGEHLVRALSSDAGLAPELRRRTVRVEEGREARVDFAGEPPEARRVRGQVATPLSEGSAGLVLLRVPGSPPPDPADLVFQGQIGVQGDDPEAGRWVVAEGLVQPSGRWELEGVPPGRYTLDVYEQSLLATLSGGPAELRERRELVVE